VSTWLPLKRGWSIFYHFVYISTSKVDRRFYLFNWFFYPNVRNMSEEYSQRRHLWKLDVGAHIIFCLNQRLGRIMRAHLKETRIAANSIRSSFSIHKVPRPRSHVRYKISLPHSLTNSSITSHRTSTYWRQQHVLCSLWSFISLGLWKWKWSILPRLPILWQF
jgi:REP element-mobilizing transposase RayT